MSFVPGNRYRIDKSDYESNRLNFTYQPEEANCEGIKRIGKVLDRF